MDPSNKHIDRLETEVLIIIFEYAIDSSPRTASSLEKTCNYFQKIVNLVKHRHKTLYINEGGGLTRSSTKLRQWIKQPEILTNIRTLTVDHDLREHFTARLALMYDDDDLWKLLVEFISKLSRLRRLIWNLPTIPVTILEAFHTYHSRWSELRLFKFEPSQDGEPSNIDRALAKSPVLTHLRTLCPYSSSITHRNLQVMAFRRIVTMAPIRFASLRTHSHGDNIRPDPDQMKPFQTSRKPNSHIRRLTLDGYHMSKTTLDDWSSVVDFSVLEEVKFTRGSLSIDYFQHAATLLPNLKHISLNFATILAKNSGARELGITIRQYFAECSPLQSLSLWHWRGVVGLDALLKRHGSSLKSLQLHEQESSYSLTNLDDRCLSVGELRQIIDSCKVLRDLTIDLNRSTSVLNLDTADSNVECFEILRNAKLDSLQIYFDYGMLWLNHTHTIGSTHDHEEVSQEPNISQSAPASGAMDVDLAHMDSEESINMQSDDLNSDGEPAAKRVKKSRLPVEPSKKENITQYVESIWKMLFRNSYGAAKLDIKMGDWESYMSDHLRQPDPDEPLWLSHTTARRCERDDQRDQCTVRMRTKNDYN